MLKYSERYTISNTQGYTSKELDRMNEILICLMKNVPEACLTREQLLEYFRDITFHVTCAEIVLRSK